MHTYERCARVLIMFNQPWYMNAFVHHPLVILLTALEAFSYMMTCEINNITWHHPMVSELLANWIIFAKKCAELVTPVRIIAINCPLRFLPRVNNLAQFEGFLSRFPLGFILLIRPQFGYPE
nr:rhomboid-like protein 2 [Quercus suber]